MPKWDTRSLLCFLLLFKLSKCASEHKEPQGESTEAKAIPKELCERKLAKLACPDYIKSYTIKILTQMPSLVPGYLRLYNENSSVMY